VSSTAARIEVLTRELSTLRAQLAGLPEAPFDALEITAAVERYLVPLGRVRLVVALPWPSPVPDAPPWLLGVVRVGAALVPVVDLAQRIGGQTTPLTADLWLVLLERPWLGLVVSSVQGVIHVHPEAVVPLAGEPGAVVGLCGAASLLCPEALDLEVALDA